MSMRFAIVAVVLLAAASSLPGCVQQQQYDDLMTSYRAQEQQLLALQSELESARANETGLRSQLANTIEDLRALERMRAGQSKDLNELLADYERLRKSLDELQLGPLPAELESALSALAAQYPNEMSFDARRGMLRFAADFTFDLGDASLKPNAAALIAKLATILNAPEASGFEVKVVGHTDNVPISKPSTRAKHPTNTYLSAHRAISVRDALVAAKVQPARIEVAGYGEFRPIAANGPKGSAENRRVEVYLSPLTFSMTEVMVEPAAAGSSAPVAKPVVEDPMK
ncbi:MAG: OmpA family protein [Phycisphaerales bacterium]|nr:OmpA family protein [Phycisphaerales bacterium]